MVKTMTDPVSVSVHLIGGGMDIICKILTLIDTAIRCNTASCCKEALSALKDTITRIQPILNDNSRLAMKKRRDKDSAVDNWFEELDGLLCNASQIVEQCTPTGLFSLSYNSKITLITELTKDIEKHLQLSNLLIMIQNQEILDGQRQIKEALASSSRYADTAKAVHTPIGIMNSKKVLALLSIGFVLFLVNLATIPITGRSIINLAKSFGPAMVYDQKKSWEDHNGANLGAQNVANLGVEDAGSLLRKAIADGNAELLKRFLDNGVNPNAEDYNHRTPLHMAAAEGLHLLDRILLDSGASVFSLDRWGNTPLDEAKKCGSRPLIQILEEAAINASGLVSTECFKDSENKKGAYSFKDSRREISEPTEKIRAKICTVFPFHPWTPIEKRRNGLVMWVPETIEALLQATAQHFGSVGTTVLTEDAGEILFIDLIQHNQKLYIGNLEELR